MLDWIGTLGVRRPHVRLAFPDDDCGVTGHTILLLVYVFGTCQSGFWNRLLYCNEMIIVINSPCGFNIMACQTYCQWLKWKHYWLKKYQIAPCMDLAVRLLSTTNQHTVLTSAPNDTNSFTYRIYLTSYFLYMLKSHWSTGTTVRVLENPRFVHVPLSECAIL